MDEKKETPLTTETQIEDWVNACRFKFRKIMADPQLQKKALKDNSSVQEKGYPLPEGLSENEIELYSAAISEASAVMMDPSGSYIKHFIIQSSELNNSASEENQAIARKLMDESLLFEKTYLFPMFQQEIILHHGLESDDERAVYKQLAKIVPPPTDDWESQATEIFRQCMADEKELLRAFNSRGGINTNGEVKQLTLKSLHAALTAIETEDKSKYLIHDEGRIICELQNIGVLSATDLQTSDKLKGLTTSDILKYDAIAMHIRTEITKSIPEMITSLSYIPETQYGLLFDAVEAQLFLLQKKQRAEPVLKTVKELVSDDILFIQTHQKLTEQLSKSNNDSAKAIWDEVKLLHKKRDPNFSVPELTKILQGVQNKKHEDLLSTANKITTLESNAQNYQKLKTGLIIFASSCLIVAAAAATLFSFGILAPITLPLIAVSGSLLVGAVGSLGYKSNQYKNKMSALREELTLELKGLIKPTEIKEIAAGDVRNSPTTVTETEDLDNSQISSPAPGSKN